MEVWLHILPCVFGGGGFDTYLLILAGGINKVWCFGKFCFALLLEVCRIIELNEVCMKFQIGEFGHCACPYTFIFYEVLFFHC